jgi:hypothetical protein
MTCAPAQAARPSDVRMAARTGHRRRLRERCRLVAIVVTYPIHGVDRVVLVTALGCEIEQIVRAHHHLHTAPVGRVGVKDLARVVLVEHADARRFLAREWPHAVVVEDLALGPFFRREADAEVVVEVAAMRGHPLGSYIWGQTLSLPLIFLL